MTSDDAVQPVIAPPVQRGPMPESRPVWPSVMGVLAAIYGGLMLTCNTGGLFSPQLYAWMTSAGSPSGSIDSVVEIELAVMQRHRWGDLMIAAMAMLASAWLVWASINLTRRRPTAALWLVRWAWVELALLALAVALQIAFSAAVVRELRDEGLAQHIDDSWISGMANVLFTVLLGAGLPIFVLFWFRRAKIRAHIATWQHI